MDWGWHPQRVNRSGEALQVSLQTQGIATYRVIGHMDCQEKGLEIVQDLLWII